MKPAREWAEMWLTPTAENTALYANDEKTNLINLIGAAQKDAMASAVPAGCVAVPRKADADMLKAGRSAFEAQIDKRLDEDAETRAEMMTPEEAAWDAMIEAPEKPQRTEGET